MAVGYTDSFTGAKLESFPASLDTLERVEVEYKEFSGWNKVGTSTKPRNAVAKITQSITGTKSFEELPKGAQDYVVSFVPSATS